MGSMINKTKDSKAKENLRNVSKETASKHFVISNFSSAAAVYKHGLKSWMQFDYLKPRDVERIVAQEKEN